MLRLKICIFLVDEKKNPQFMYMVIRLPYNSNWLPRSHFTWNDIFSIEGMPVGVTYKANFLKINIILTISNNKKIK